MKRFFACAALLLSALCGAQTYSVQVFEEGKAVEGAEFTAAQGILSACMDELFMSGRVATSQEPGFGTQKTFEALGAEESKTLEEEYVTHVVRILYSLRPAREGLPPVPAQISFRFIEIDGLKVLAKGALPGMDYPAKGEDAVALLKKYYGSAGAKIIGACLEAEK
jgi:hypothetical protein